MIIDNDSKDFKEIMKRSHTRFSKAINFHDNLGSAAKIFARLNSYRKLNGFREVEWNEILCELAVLRSHQLVRSRTGLVQLLQIGGAKFNFGVPYIDIAAYSPIEEKDGKQVPAHRMMESIWHSMSKISEAMLDPLAKFAAISVYMSEKTVCITIFFSMMFPNSFLPERFRDGKINRIPKKRKSKKGKKRIEENRDFIVTNGTNSDSSNEYLGSCGVGETTADEPETPMHSEIIEVIPIAINYFEEDERKATPRTSLDGPVCAQGSVAQENTREWDSQRLSGASSN